MTDIPTRLTLPRRGCGPLTDHVHDPLCDPLLSQPRVVPDLSSSNRRGHFSFLQAHNQQGWLKLTLMDFERRTGKFSAKNQGEFEKLHAEMATLASTMPDLPRQVKKPQDRRPKKNRNND